MKPEHWITLANLLLTAIGLYFGPKLAVKRSLEQFRSQKWWETQNEKYAEALTHLAIVKHYLEGAAEVSAGAHPRLEARLSESSAELHEIAATSQYYLSSEASKAIKEFMGKWNLQPGMQVDEMACFFLENVRRCYETVENEALRARGDVVKQNISM